MQTQFPLELQYPLLYPFKMQYGRHAAGPPWLAQVTAVFFVAKFTIFNKLISIDFQTILPSAGVALNVTPRNRTATKKKNTLKFILICLIAALTIHNSELISSHSC